VSFEVLDEEEKPVLFVEHSAEGKEWLTIIQPAGRMSIEEGIDAESFFDMPYKTACALAAALRGCQKISA
jgi:hypothetical protein